MIEHKKVKEFRGTHQRRGESEGVRRWLVAAGAKFRGATEWWRERAREGERESDGLRESERVRDRGKGEREKIKERGRGCLASS